MDDIFVWIGVAISLVTGAGGWIFAGIANSRAKQANTLAEKANRIATGAVKEAKKANTIANGANQLSEEANSLIKRQVSQQNEDWFVKWESKWEQDATEIVLTNIGRDAARTISYVVVGKDDLHEVGRNPEDVPPGESFRIHLPQITERRIEHARGVTETLRRNQGSPVFIMPSAFHPNVEVTIIWKTGLDRTQEQVLTQRLS